MTEDSWMVCEPGRKHRDRSGQWAGGGGGRGVGGALCMGNRATILVKLRDYIVPPPLDIISFHASQLAIPDYF